MFNFKQNDEKIRKFKYSKFKYSKFKREKSNFKSMVCLIRKKKYFSCFISLSIFIFILYYLYFPTRCII